MADPCFTIKTTEQINLLLISPYEWSKNLICIASESKIKVGLLRFQEEFDDLEGEQEVQLNFIEEFFHRPRVHCLSWNPHTNIHTFPKTVEFCAAGNDFRLRILSSDLSSTSTIKELHGHDDYINDCSYDFSGDYLVSVGDDAICKVWSTSQQYKLIYTFYLTSSGMSVSWLPDDQGKFLVGEKKGLFRLYNACTLKAILTVHCSPSPLMSSTLTTKHVVFVAEGKLFRADIIAPGHNVESMTIHTGFGHKVSICPINENYIATVERPSNTLKVVNMKSKLTVFSSNLELFGGFCWHHRLPILIVGNNSQITFYKINPK